MIIRKNKRELTIEFQSASQISNDVQKEEQTQIIKNFTDPVKGLQINPIINHDLDKLKKKLIAFTIQYGSKNQKTTSIFLNYLENTRDVGISYLKNKDLVKALSCFVDCLSFINPEYDEVFLEKFINIKIDVINKLMFCIFQVQTHERNQYNYDSRRLDFGLKLMNDFFDKIKQYPFYNNFLKSQNCLLQVTYFYFGRLYKKKNKFKKAEEQFKIALQIIKDKMQAKVFLKNQHLNSFQQNLSIKITYKLSKCYREDKNEKAQAKQFQYQKMALIKARQINKPLFVYLNRKIRFFKKKKVFESRLLKIDGRKKIQQEVCKIIQDSKQNQIESLYDIYLDQLQQI